MGITVSHVRDDFASAARGRIKMLVVGQPGSGKTRSASTWPNVLFADAEGGMLSVRDRDARKVKIESIADMEELCSMLDQRPEVRAKMFGGPVDTIVVDTIDEIARIVIRERLASERHETMEMRDWGYLGDTLRGFVRAYRNLDLNVVFNVHVKGSEDAATGRIEYKPAIQGAMGDELAGYVDLAVLLLARPMTDPATNERVLSRYFQTFPDAAHDWLKDRSGLLPFEFPINLNDDYERLATAIFGTEAEIRDAAVAELTEAVAKTAKRAAPADKPKGRTKKPEPPPPVPETDPTPPHAPDPEPTLPPPPDPEPEPVDTVVDPTPTDVVPVDGTESDPALIDDLEQPLAGDPEPEPEPAVEPIVVEVAADDPLAELAASPVCSECGTPVPNRDHADFSVIRFQTVLCREHFAERNQKARK